MKIVYTGLLALLLLTKVSFSQSIYLVSLQDSSAVSFAKIKIRVLPSNTTVLFMSNAAGAVALPLTYAGKKIVLSISCVSFQPLLDTFIVSGTKTYYLHKEETNLNTFVVSAQYTPTSIANAVQKINVIDNKKIQLMGAQNLKDVLSNELNIRLSQDNVLGSSVSLQGISGQQVKILVDGVPVNGRLNGNIDVSQINMNTVERIEIIEGPLSVNYGTDALAGTINIITKKTQRESLSASAATYYESIGQYNVSGRIGVQKNKNYFALSGGRNYFDGWNATEKPFFIEQKHIADSTRFKSWKPKEQYFGTFNYNRTIQLLKLNFTSDYFVEQLMNRGLPRLPYYETAFDDYYHTQRFNNSLNLSGKLKKKFNANILFAYNHYQRIKNTYFKDLTTLDQVLTTAIGKQDTTVFNNSTARGSISTSSDSVKLNYEIGYDINHETALGLRIKNSKQQLSDFALFSTAEYKPNIKLTIRPGLRIIYNTTYKAPLVPSINILYKPTASAAIRFSYAKGFRAPSLKELYFYFVDINHNITGNTALKAEQSHNFNFSFTHSSIHYHYFLKNEAALFYNYIGNMIALAQQNTVQYSYFNVANYQTLGGQLQSEFSRKQLKTQLGVAYVGRYSRLADFTPASKFIYSPEAKANINYEFKKQNIRLALFYKYTGTLPTYITTNENQLSIATFHDYHTADVSIAKLFFDKQLTIAIGSKNLFNVTTISGAGADGIHTSGASTTPVAMGRTYFVKVDFNFKSKK